MNSKLPSSDQSPNSRMNKYRVAIFDEKAHEATSTKKLLEKFKVKNFLSPEPDHRSRQKVVQNSCTGPQTSTKEFVDSAKTIFDYLLY